MFADDDDNEMVKQKKKPKCLDILLLHGWNFIHNFFDSFMNQSLMASRKVDGFFFCISKKKKFFFHSLL